MKISIVNFIFMSHLLSIFLLVKYENDGFFSVPMTCLKNSLLYGKHHFR